MSGEVERLRAAATAMRERAEAATEAWGVSAWHHEGLGYSDARGLVYDVQDRLGTHVADADCEELAEHIASWHPAVALAVATLLEHIATGIESGNDLDWSNARDVHDALALADAYLGT